MNQQRVKDLQSNTRRSNIGFITVPRKKIQITAQKKMFEEIMT